MVVAKRYRLLANRFNLVQLAMGILASLFGGAYYATSGPKKPVAAATPPINAGSSDEADFIKCVPTPGG